MPNNIGAARIAAHQAFDQLWLGGKMSRREAYKWLAKQLKISREECHIKLFNERQCRIVVELCGALEFEGVRVDAD